MQNSTIRDFDKELLFTLFSFLRLESLRILPRVCRELRAKVSVYVHSQCKAWIAQNRCVDHNEIFHNEKARRALYRIVDFEFHGLLTKNHSAIYRDRIGGLVSSYLWHTLDRIFPGCANDNANRWNPSIIPPDSLLNVKYRLARHQGLDCGTIIAELVGLSESFQLAFLRTIPNLRLCLKWLLHYRVPPNVMLTIFAERRIGLTDITVPKSLYPYLLSLIPIYVAQPCSYGLWPLIYENITQLNCDSITLIVAIETIFQLNPKRFDTTEERSIRATLHDQIDHSMLDRFVLEAEFIKANGLPAYYASKGLVLKDL